MQAVRLFDLLVCYVLRAAYANTWRAAWRMQIGTVALMRAHRHACLYLPAAGFFLYFISRCRNYRSHSHRSAASVIDLPANIRLHFYLFIYTEKNIVNFNKYLVEYCQLNIY